MYKFLLIGCLFISLLSYGQKNNEQYNITNRTRAFIGNNLSLGKYFFESSTGEEYVIRNIKKANNNLGGGVLEDFKIAPTFFITTGVRLLTSESNVEFKTRLSEFDYAKTFYKFEIRHWQLTVPLFIGKTIYLSKDPVRTLDLFLGTSIGLGMVCSEKQETQYKKANNNNVVVGVGDLPFKDKLSATTLLNTLDIGISIAPFKFQNVSFGIALSQNFQKMPFIKEEGVFLAGNEVNHFKFDLSRRYTNVLFSFSYSFGKKWRKYNRQSPD